MGIVIRQSTGNVISNYIGVAIGAVNTIILYPRVFIDNPDYYGLVQLILAWALVISSFTNLGIPNIILRYFPDLKPQAQKELMSFMLVYPIPILLLVSGIFLYYDRDLIQNLNDDQLFLKLWYYILPMAVLNVYFEIFSAIAQHYMITTLPVFLKEVVRKVVATVLLALFWFGFISIEGFIFWFMISLLLQNLYMIIFLFRKKYLMLSRKFDNENIREKLVYGLFLTATLGSGYLMQRVDSLMIGMYLDLDSVAFYSVAFFMGTILNIPGKSLIIATRPVIARNFSNKNYAGVNKIYKDSALNLMAIGIIMFALLWLNIEDIFNLLPEDYRAAKWVVFIIAISYLFNISSGQNGTILAQSDYYRVNLYSLFLLMALTVILNIIMIPNFGMEGAAMASLMAMTLNNIFKIWYLHKKFGFHPYEPDMKKLIAIFSFVFLLFYWVDLPFNSVVNILIKSPLILIVFIFLIYRFKVSYYIINILEVIFKRIRQFTGR